MERPNITHEINGKIIKLDIEKTVRKNGLGGAVNLPKSLIGEKVRVIYEVKNEN